MSNLLVVDVFEAYYEGRKAPFSAERSEEAASGRREERKPKNKDGSGEGTQRAA